jgi:lipopolysaccharide/colanic/teichoic acid biosynthesis glycosyltransferase
MQGMPDVPVGAVAIAPRPQAPIEPPVERPSPELITSDLDAKRPTGLLAAAWWQLAVKRSIDIVASAVLLLLLVPVLFLIAAAIRLTSWGPVLYVQERIGRDGRPFRMYKFRSMHVRHDLTREELLALNEVTGPMFKIRCDPRLTRVGRWLRASSVDELPQLLNVLWGDMSMVGPRPPLPEEYAVFGPRERARLSVKPGITCIWQVSGRSDLDFDTWVEMDLEYISTWTLRRDLGLLVRTIPAVLTARGAY